MRVLLISTYELGHQPLHVASPAAALRHAGHEARVLDLSVEPWDTGLVAWAEAIAFSVPMHTAMRLAMEAARRVKEARPGVPICFYGLYAPIGRDSTVGRLADRLIAGEYEPGLVAWVDGLAGERPGPDTRPPVVQLGRGRFHLPARDLLPPLDRYAHLALGGDERVVGYVEATHGCAHRCRHCPVPVVYDGRLRVVASEVVMEDIAQLVTMGAQHVTFGDPDFLNGAHHSRRLVEGVHGRFPNLTFDCTVKVEHVLEHAEVWADFADAGCLFVVSAVETTNDEILARLDKGHTSADASEAIAVLRAHGIEMRPSFLPFTPWTTFDDLLDLLAFVADHDLIGNVDPVQYTIRLLLPEQSLLLDDPTLTPHLGPYDPAQLTYIWASSDPMLDVLQRDLARLVERATTAGETILGTFMDVNAAVRVAAGTARPELIVAGSTEGRPRLTEPWFC